MTKATKKKEKDTLLKSLIHTTKELTEYLNWQNRPTPGHRVDVVLLPASDGDVDQQVHDHALLPLLAGFRVTKQFDRTKEEKQIASEVTKFRVPHCRSDKVQSAPVQK